MKDVYNRLLSLEPRGIMLGTERIAALMEPLGHPERAASRTVTVTGTNGKGSVAATISAAAHRAGTKVGLYTSPHLISPTERFRVGEQDMDEATFARLGAQVLDTADRHAIELTFFEALTAMAFLWFKEQKVELQVLEVGLGGARDATAVVTPDIGVLTGIAQDHTELLGDTMEEIAREKLGAFKAKTEIVAAIPPSLLHVAPSGWLLDRNLRWRRTSTGLRVQGPFGIIFLPEPKLIGQHQYRNAAVASAALVRLGYSERQIGEGMRHVRWPGRCHFLPGTPPVLVDGAHNPDGVRALVNSLPEFDIAPGYTLVFGAHPKKDISRMLKRMAETAGRIILTTVPRLLKPNEVAAFMGRRMGVSTESNLAAALASARALGKPVVVAGSLYLAGAVLDLERQRG